MLVSGQIQAAADLSQWKLHLAYVEEATCNPEPVLTHYFIQESNHYFRTPNP